MLSYSLSAVARSGPRVTLWRRLRRLGVVTLAGGSQLLPARDECLEAFQWLAQELRQARGEAVVMRVQQFEGLADAPLIDLFQAARQEEYGAIAADATALEKALAAKTKPKARSQALDELVKLRRRHAEVARIDYFSCAAGERVAAQLARIERRLSPAAGAPQTVAGVTLADYRNKRWVTRPRPHVDRLACAWLIRRFVDPKAVIRYAARPRAGEIAFDMEEGEFGHQGNLCSFEKMIRAFGLDDAGLRALAEIVHEIDLRDERYARPETAGIDAVLAGWLQANLSDAELESRGSALFEGLYGALSGHTPTATGKKQKK
ncbi:MAG TPA: chromate resistance protein ChrB domain-containing protein [Anaerolineae bacterium]|nr:chromate resistance protein ChrB domain-containing protein [Anaerolineae bacterium]